LIIRSLLFFKSCVVISFSFFFLQIYEDFLILQTFEEFFFANYQIFDLYTSQGNPLIISIRSVNGLTYSEVALIVEFFRLLINSCPITGYECFTRLINSSYSSLSVNSTVIVTLFILFQLVNCCYYFLIVAFDYYGV